MTGPVPSAPSRPRSLLAFMACVVVGCVLFATAGLSDSKRIHDVLYPEGLLFTLQGSWIAAAIVRTRPALRRVLAAVGFFVLGGGVILLGLLPGLSKLQVLVVTTGGIAVASPAAWVLGRKPRKTSST